jgi:deoxyribose-phosphate aldolase
VAEACLAAADGADEIDMVMDVGRFKSGDDAYTRSEVQAVKGALKRLSYRLGRRVSLKVIIETPRLTPDEIQRVSLLCADAEADFIKTSTGFGPRPTSLEDVWLIKGAIGGAVPIKAAGGIHTYGQAMAFLEAGAQRLGASRSVAILKGA